MERAMKNKVLVLALVTCVAGIVTAPGCGATETTPSEVDASPDVASETSAPVDASSEDAGACPADIRLTVEELLDDPGFKPGKLQTSACSAQDLVQFEKNLANPTVKSWKALADDLAPSCADCIITPSESPVWGPIVYLDEAGELGFNNFGACFGVLSGSDACGEAVQFFDVCLSTACDRCSKSLAERERCVDIAADLGGMCRGFFETVQAECPNIADHSAKCNGTLAAAKTLCGPLDAGDGGTDAADANDQ
jgi:hypothetical protein